MQRRSLLVLAAIVCAFGAPWRSRAQDKKSFKPEELDQMLAPIALYPDPLLSQILMACGYPLEVVEAARWSKANPNLKGDAAVKAVEDKEWDTSVKSLVAFPDVLKQLNEHLDWTQKLGDAMIEQESAVADSIQRLRAKASAAGNLQSTPQQTVTTEGSGDNTQYIIQPTNTEVVYVPQYNPSWAYGSWPYPAYPPVWYPWGGALATGIFWGLGIAAGAAMFGGWNWGGYGNSYANINVNKAVNIDRNFDRNRPNRPDRPDRPDRPGAGGGGERWQHRPEHRKGVAYRDPATRQRFNQAQRPGVAQRDQFRGRLEGGAGDNRPGGGQGIANRPGGGPAAGNRPGGGGQGIANRPGGGQVNRPQQRPNALGGVNHGQQINRDAARGRQQINRAQSHPNYNRGGGGGGRPGGGGGGRPGGGGGGGRGGGGGGGGGGGRGGGGGGGRGGGGGGRR